MRCRASRRQARENLSTLLATQLFDADQRVVTVFNEYATRLNEDVRVPAPELIDRLRELRRKNPIVRQGILVDRDGYLIFPLASDLVGVDDLEVGAALPGMTDARPFCGSDLDATNAADANTPFEETVTKGGKAQSQQVIDLPQQAIAPPPTWTDDWAWQPWYMGDGAQVIFWRARSDGSSVGILLERSRWMADMIGQLPDDRVRGETSTTEFPTIGLFDESERLMYRWGNDELDGENLLVQKPLSSPLSSWELRAVLGCGVGSDWRSAADDLLSWRHRRRAVVHRGVRAHDGPTPN